MFLVCDKITHFHRLCFPGKCHRKMTPTYQSPGGFSNPVTPALPVSNRKPQNPLL